VNSLPDKTRFEEQFPRVFSYLKGLVQFDSPAATVFTLSLRQFTRWFFDLMRNALIAGALQYISQKTHSIPLQYISRAAYLLLLIYCTSYVQTWMLRPFHPMSNQRLARWLDIGVNIVIILPLVFIVSFSVPEAIRVIAESQAR
jgi:hypothetical protein